MNSGLAQDKAIVSKKAKSNNDRCKSCRKCYNSGICLMPWPGFGPPEKDGIIKDSKDNNQK